MIKSWNGLNDIVKTAHTDSIRGAISELKSRISSMLVTDAAVASEMPDFGALISGVSSDIISKLDKLDLATLVSNFDVMNLHIDTGTIPNDQLNHIWQKMETRYRKEKRSKKKKSGLFKLGRKRVSQTWYESIPYQVPIYGPDINALVNTFSAHATNPWKTSFQNHVDTMIAEISRLVSEQVILVSDNVLTSAEQKFQSALDMNKDAEHNAREMANSLMTSQHKVEEIKRQFQ